MIEAKIYFNDLSEELQEELWQKTKQELRNCGMIAPKGKDESREEFEQRVEEEADNYINTHNFVNRYVI